MRWWRRAAVVGACAWGVRIVCAATAGEAAAPAPGHTQEFMLQSGGLKRSYRLHDPARPDPDRPAPLLLVFHGGGGTPQQIERESRFSELADREGFVVVYPAGYRRSWNDGRGADSVAAQRDGVDDVAFVATLIDQVATIRRIDGRRVYATGISNGAMFSHQLALRMPSRIAAIAPVAGGLPEPLRAQLDGRDPVSALIVNGTDDPLVPYGGGEVQVLGNARGRVIGAEEVARLWAAHDACSPTPTIEDSPGTAGADGCTTTRLSYRDCAQGADVVVYRLNGGGHTWPGGTQYLPRRLVGRVCRDLDGSALIWDFLQRHRKP